MRNQKTMTQHLIELRQRGLKSIIFLIICFLICFLCSHQIFEYLFRPLINNLPPSSKLITINITASVFLPIKIAFHTAVLFTAPFVFYQIWQFSAPGLYKNERRFFQFIVFLSSVLFFLGILFAYMIALPFLFYFFAQALPAKVHFMPDISFSLDFINRMLLLFGLSFQVPLVSFILVHLNFISYKQLKTFRPYIIVAAFVIGMFLTPPDVVSQIMLALPLCLLFELGLLLSNKVTPIKERINSQKA